MTDKTQEKNHNKTDAGCCKGPGMEKCRDMMQEMMQKFCGDDGNKEGGFDCAAMMEKMKGGESPKQ